MEVLKEKNTRPTILLWGPAIFTWHCTGHVSQHITLRSTDSSNTYKHTISGYSSLFHAVHDCWRRIVRLCLVLLRRDMTGISHQYTDNTQNIMCI